MNLSLRGYRVTRLKDMVNSIFQSDLYHKIAGTLVTRVCLLILGLITTIVVARILGPEGRGLYAVAIATCALGVQFGNFGLHASNTYYLSREQELLPELLGNSLIIGLVVGHIGVLIAGFIFSIWPTLIPIQGDLLLLALISVPLALNYLLLQNLLLGQHRVMAYNVIELCGKVFVFLFICMLFIIDYVTPTSLIAASVASAAVSNMFCYSAISQGGRIRPRIELNVFINSSYYGFKAYIAAFFSFLTLRIGLFIVENKFGTVSAGYYSIALTMGDLMYMFPVVIGNIIFPRLSAMMSDSNKIKVTNRVALIVGITMIGACLLVWIIADFLIKLLFGPDYLLAVPILIGLLPGIVVLSINTIYMNYFASAGMPSVTIYSPIIAVSIILIFSLFDFIEMTPVIVALTTSFSWLVMLAISVLWINLKGHNL
jgi:O-antigen/teichoic acid export membrane protein